MNAENRLKELGLILPEPMQLPPGVTLPFRFVKVIGRRVLISGHLPTDQTGALWPVLGKVGSEVSIEQAYSAARQVGLCILGSLKRELGDLNRITHWVKAFGMVNVASDFHQTAPVINGFSDLILEVFGEDVGSHTRSAVGFSTLPFMVPVEIEAEVEID